MNKYERQVFVAIFFIGVLLLAAGLWSVVNSIKYAGKLISSAGLVAALAGLIQLEVSGFFSSLIEKFENEEEYPYGPPSYVTREIIGNPDHPIRTRILGLAFFEVRTGFWLIVVGTLLQLLGTWL